MTQLEFAPSEAPVRHEVGGPLTAEQFASSYPYLIRYCRQAQLQGDKFVLEPNAGEHASFGVFFYAAKTGIFEPQNSSLPLVVRTGDLIDQVEEFSRALDKGVLVMPSVLYTDLIGGSSVNPGRPMSLSEAYEKERTVYEQWPVLNEAKKVNGSHVFTVPTRFEVPSRLSLV